MSKSGSPRFTWAVHSTYLFVVIEDISNLNKNMQNSCSCSLMRNDLVGLL